MEQEGSVGIQEEVPEVAFAVFVADVADEGEVGVVMLCSDLLQRLLDQLVALVMSVREQEQDQNVGQPLLHGAAQGREELLFQHVLQELVNVGVDCLLLHLHRQLILREMPRKLLLVILIL